MNQLIAHLFGDFVLQSHVMAVEKVTSSAWCLLHAVMYCLPFLFLVTDAWQMAIIGGTHFFIDRYRLARRFKLRYERLWGGTEPFAAAPDWLSGWILIVVDNSFHLAVNALVLS